MQLPNKLYTYKKSTLAQIPIVLDAIKNGLVPVVDLYKQIRPLLDDADFVFGGDTYVKSDGVKQ
jgi:hypothetical protein